MGPTTGIGKMNAYADLALSINEAERTAAEAVQARNEAIEARIVGGDVQALNDTAEMEIFGSRGRTYLDAAGNPLPAVDGKLEDISKDPKYGKTQADRDAFRDEYETSIQSLLDDGFELSQVKMIMDMREGDQDKVGKLAGKYISQILGAAGAALTPAERAAKTQEAVDKAEDFYVKKDEKRKELIKDGGAFTPDEYDRVRNGEDLYDPNVTPDDPNVTPAPGNVVRTPELDNLETALTSARTNLAQIRAQRETTTFTFKKATNKKLEAALKAYDEAEQAAGAEAVNVLMAAGYTDAEDLRFLINQGTAAEAHKLTAEQMIIELQSAQGKKLANFYDFIARNSQDGFFSRGTAKKMAAMAPFAIGIGVAAAPLTAVAAAAAGGAGLVGAAVFGTATATRISRGLMGAKVNKSAATPRLAQSKYEKRMNEINTAINEAEADGRVYGATNLIDAAYRPDTKEGVRTDRKIATKYAGSAALVGAGTAVAVGAVLDHFGWLGHGGGGNGTPENPGNGGNGTPENPGGGSGLTPEQVKILKSPEFKQMVERGEQIRADIHAAQPNMPQAVVDRVATAQLLQEMNYAAFLEQQAKS